LVEILAKSEQPLSALVSDLPPSAVTPEIRVDLPDAVKFDVVERVKKKFVECLKTQQGLGPKKLVLRDLITIDGVRAIFEEGWGLIRASNTQPALVLRFEAVSSARLGVIQSLIEHELLEARRSLGC
jgi:phosphomannomutase / phosphoglucomutase